MKAHELVKDDAAILAELEKVRARKKEKRDKEKKAAKLKDIQQKLNPFDVKVTKLKHDVGGRKIIGTTGRPAQSKQAGIEQVCLSVQIVAFI